MFLLGPGVPLSQAPRQHATSSNQVMFTAKSSCQWGAVATEWTAVSGWRARRSAIRKKKSAKFWAVRRRGGVRRRVVWRRVVQGNPNQQQTQQP